MWADTKENDILDNNEWLTEEEVFKKIKEDLVPIQENLEEKKITIDEARQQLQQINERIQWTHIENKDEKEIWKVFDKLLKLEKDVDESDLLVEVSEVEKVLEKLTKSELDKLQKEIEQPSNYSYTERPINVQKWIAQSVENLNDTINIAANDSNKVAAWAWRMMKNLLS